MIKDKLKYFVFLLFLLILGCCCSISNNDYCKVNVVTNDTCLIETKADTLVSKGNIRIKCERNSKPIEISFKTENNDNKIISLRPYISTKFIFGNFFTPPGFPISYIIDLTKKNRNKIFSYDKIIYVDVNNTDKKYFRFGFPKNNKNKFSVILSVPEGNLFYIKDKDNYKSKSGFLGFGIGLNYYFSEYYYINTNIKSIINFIIPVPAPFDPSESFEFAINSFISSNIYRDFDKYHLGLGLHYSMFDLDDKFNDSSLNRTIKYESLGIVTSIKRLITKEIQVALNYQPSLLRLSNKVNYEYSHVIYFEILMDIRIK